MLTLKKEKHQINNLILHLEELEKEKPTKLKARRRKKNYKDYRQNTETIEEKC